MSDVLALAAALTALNTDDLTRLILERRLRATDLRDHFDLAEALLRPESVQLGLHALDRGALLTLLIAADGGDDGLGADEIAERLAAHSAAETTPADVGNDASALMDAGLARATDRIHVYGAVRRELATWHEEGLPDWRTLAAQPAPAPDTVEASSDDEARAAAAALVVATETAELLHALDDAEPRERLSGGLTNQDVRCLAEAASLTPHRLTALFALAQHAGLVTLDGRRWGLTVEADAWLTASTPERWLRLAAAWHRQLDDDDRRILALWHDRDWAMLADAVAWHRPGLDDAAHHSDSLLRDARRLGLCADTVPTSAGRHLLGLATPAAEPVLADASAALSDADTVLTGAGSALVDAARACAAHLPHEAHTLYVQHDLTLVATGPVRPDVDARLRRLASVEARLPASTYRISRSSLRRAAGRGQTRDAIEQLLQEVSLNGVPQPLAYLIDDVFRRDARLTVTDLTPPETGSLIEAHDSHDLGPLLVDRSLSMLRLETVSALTARSRLLAATVHQALTQSHYAAVLRQAEPRRRRAHAADRHEARDDAEECARQLAESARDGADHTEAWHARQLETARRHRSLVTVVLRLPDGGSAVRTIEPLGLSRGRVRARECGTEVERTFPLSRIESVETA